MNDGNYALYFHGIVRDSNYLLNKKMKTLSLGKHDIRVLHNVYLHKTLTQQNLCSLLKEDKVTISKAVKNLERDGYIEKCKTLRDKRVTQIFLTQKGINIREHIRNALSEIDEIVLGVLNENELLEFLDMLMRISTAMEKEAERIEVDHL